MVNRPDHPQPRERIKAWLFPPSNRMMVEVPAPYNEAWGALTNGQQSFSSGVFTGNTRVSHARPRRMARSPAGDAVGGHADTSGYRYASLDADTNARGRRTTNPDGNAAASSRLCADASGMAVTEGHAFDSLRAARGKKCVSKAATWRIRPRHAGSGWLRETYGNRAFTAAN